MKSEFINANGYFLLIINIFTLGVCVITCVFWASLCLYDDVKPKFFHYKLRMFGASILAIVANSFALIRMFDSFLVTQLSIDKYIIQNTLVDRFCMAITFSVLLSSAWLFKRIEENKEDKIIS